MSRFFPNGGNGNGSSTKNDNPFGTKPGDILPLFDKGYLKYDVRSGERYITLTEEAYKVIRDKNPYIYKDK